MGEQFDDFVRRLDDVFVDGKIYVAEIRPGSIVADLLPVIASTVPLIGSQAAHVLAVEDFVRRWGERLLMLSSGEVPEESGRRDLRTWADTVEAIARDPAASSTLEAAVFEDGKRELRAAFTFQTSEARKIRDVVEERLSELARDRHADHKRVLMIFTRSDVGRATVGKRSGERVQIEEIHPKPLALMYASDLAEERIKHEIRESDENIYKKGICGRCERPSHCRAASGLCCDTCS